MDIKIAISQHIAEIIKNKYSIESEPLLNIPPDKQFGDFSTNIAFSVAGNLKNNPITIATEIVSHINLPYIKKTEIVKPGFINFFIDQNTFVLDVIKKYVLPIEYEMSEQNSDKKVILEHTSVNPNKAMHIGHLRNAVLGDAIVRLLKKAGYKIEAQNYIDDSGLQVADTVNAYLNLGQPFDPQKQSFDDYCWDIYSKINKLYETDEKLKQNRALILDAIEKGNNEIAKTAEEVIAKILTCQLQQLDHLGIKYDLLVHESDIIKFNLWEVAFNKLKTIPNFIYEKEGKNKDCWVLKNDGDGGDKVFVRSDGTKVYTAKDVVYHLWKFNLIDFDFKYIKSPITNLDYGLSETSINGELCPQKFGHGDIVINLIDERQTYPQDMVKLSLKLLGYQKQVTNYHHIGYGLVNLSRETATKLGVDTSDGSEVYAMSGRKGIGVKSKDLVNLVKETIKKEKIGDKEYDEQKITNIANAAVKFYMLKNHHLSPIIFDYKEATNLNGATGPYIQYSYARAQSILNKITTDLIDLQKIGNYEVNEQEYLLAKHLNDWHEIFISASKSYTISYVSEYVLKLCALFNTFYHASPVLNADANTMAFRINLIKAYMNVLNENMQILGIDIVSQM